MGPFKELGLLFFCFVGLKWLVFVCESSNVNLIDCLLPKVGKQVNNKKPATQ